MIPHRLTFLSEAGKDVRATVAWYNDQRPGLGDEFIHDLDDTLHRIAAHPEMYSAVTQTHRRAVLHGFPYFVSYRVLHDVIQVIGVFHSHRDPLAISGQVAERGKAT